MRSIVKWGILSAAVLGALWWLRGSQQEEPDSEDFAFIEDTSDGGKVIPRKSVPISRRPAQSSPKNQSGNNPPPTPPPEPMVRPILPPPPQYDEEYMRDFLQERKEMENLEKVTIGRDDYHISKEYKAMVLPKGEGEGYYRVGAWTVVPIDYKKEEEGRPVLFNKDDKTVSVLTGLVTAKLKDGVDLEKSQEMLVDKGLEIYTVTEHLNMVHAKFSPVTAESLKEHKKKLEEMGLFAWLEVEIDRGGPQTQ